MTFRLALSRVDNSSFGKPYCIEKAGESENDEHDKLLAFIQRLTKFCVALENPRENQYC